MVAVTLHSETYSTIKLPRFALAVVLLCALATTSLQAAELSHVHDEGAQLCLICSADTGAALIDSTCLASHLPASVCKRYTHTASAYLPYRSQPPARAPPIFS